MRREVTFQKIFSDILFFGWLLILWGVIIYRLVTTSGDTKLLIYYTNWSWIFQACFFFVDYLGRVIDWSGDPIGYHMRFYNTLSIFWLVNGSIWLVIILVSIIIQENPKLLTDAANDEGGQGELGLITDAHILIHYVPGYIIILYMLLERDIIGDTLFHCHKYAFLGYSFAVKAVSVLLVIFIVIVSPAILFIIYSLIFHPQQIYGFYLSMTTIVMVAIVVIVGFNLIPYLLFFESYVAIPLSERKDY